MSHPFEALPAGRRARVFLPLLAATLVVWAAAAVIDRPLETPAAPLGIISFELAGDLATARQMIASWDEPAREHALLGLGLDFLFLALYSTTIGLACVWAAGVLRTRRWPLAAVGLPLAWGQWLAAALDAMENVALIILLLRATTDPWPRIAWWCAAPKFGLVVAGLLYAAYGAAAWLTASPGSTPRSTR